MRKYLTLLLLLVSCTSSTPSKTRLLLDWLPNPNHIPLYYGLKENIFKKHGIDLEIIKATEVTNGITYLLTDQVDLSLTYHTSFAKAKNAGMPIEITGKLIDKPLNGLIYFQNGSIKTPQDLSGKRFGYAVDSATSVLDRTLENNNIKADSLHNCHFDLIGMLLTHKVDVIYGGFYTIEGAQLKHLGYPAGHFTLDELGAPKYYELIIVSKEGNSNPLFQKALQEAIDQASKNPDHAFAAYASYHLDKSDVTLAWEKSTWLKSLPLFAKDQTIDPSITDELIAWLQLGTVQK
ncbi:ABC transporter substrate-binding protein [Chlamydiales bacterium]|nr:ABC transporter substrate-binding protein [Chlamydiales bacterium]